MKQFLKKIPGFRSDTEWKKIVASNFYLLFILISLVNGLDFFLIAIALGVFIAAIFHLGMNISTKKSSKAPIVLFLSTIVLLSFGLAVGSLKDIKVKEKERTQLEQEEQLEEEIKN